jgi:hypothetical protein
MFKACQTFSSWCPACLYASRLRSLLLWMVSNSGMCPLSCR